MRDLDATNPGVAHPKKFFPISLLMPVFAGLLTWALAEGAANEVTLEANVLAVFGLLLSGLSILAMPLPLIFNWCWQTKYFGATLFCLASVSSFGLAPLMCLVIYGSWSLEIRLSILLLNMAVIFWWCSRFIFLYRKIYADLALRKLIYVEEDLEVYYLQRGDKLIIERKLKFNQFPSNVSTVLALATAFLMVPFMGPLQKLVGIPFPHIFLIAGSLPINLMVLGLATRAFLIYYYYPWKIKRDSGKEVYVDMTNAPKKSV